MQTTLGSDDLLVVLALCREGTLDKAAAWLQRDPSSVFRAINRIEQRLGATLFERSKAGFQPSEEARELADIGARISDALSTSEAVVSRVEAAQGKRLTITTTDLLLENCFIPNLASFRSRFPGIALEFTTRNSFENMWERGVDIAIRPSSDPPGDLIGKRLATFSYQAVCAPTYPMIENLKDGKLRGGDWLVPGGPLAQHPVRKWFDAAIEAPRSVSSFDSFAALLQATRAGCGVAILPNVAKLLSDLIPINCGCLPAETDIWSLYHQSKRDNPLVAQFSSFARAVIST